ncbi:hypothetical protein [Pedobacter glucosidilyticus]|uniref:hypothetical protein n=1 Tax=Pedobacter glucosidilyticus TaxID=1122941 RepID=UPI0026EE75E1|nr:hypothetical protein [Pedobacter glucosidilyticus]
MTKSFLVGALALFSNFTLYAQSDLNPQKVPYQQNFNALDGVSKEYPAGWQGWKISSSTPSNVGRLAPGLTNVPLTVSASAANVYPGVYDFDGKIGLASNYNNDNSIILSLNTTGVPANKVLKLSFDAMVMRNLYDGTTNDFVQGLALMYRVDTVGTYKMISNDFIDNSGAPINTSKTTTGVNLKKVSFDLPQTINGKPIVQIRWVIRSVSGTPPAGRDRPNFAIDNVRVE